MIPDAAESPEASQASSAVALGSSYGPGGGVVVRFSGGGSTSWGRSVGAGELAKSDMSKPAGDGKEPTECLAVTETQEVVRDWGGGADDFSDDDLL